MVRFADAERERARWLKWHGFRLSPALTSRLPNPCPARARVRLEKKNGAGDFEPRSVKGNPRTTFGLSSLRLSLGLILVRVLVRWLVLLLLLLEVLLLLLVLLRHLLRLLLVPLFDLLHPRVARLLVFQLTVILLLPLLELLVILLLPRVHFFLLLLVFHVPVPVSCVG